MNRTGLQYVFCVLLLFAEYPVLAQELEIKDAPAYIQRNQDFQTRRAGEVSVNFGKQYYRSESRLKDQVKLLNKKSDEWTPRGPFGKEQLAGIGRVNSIQFHPTDTNIWYICVAQGGLWKTTNAGESWISVSDDLPISRTSYLAVHPYDPDIMYVALGDYAYLGHNLQANENKRNSHYGLGIYKTVDGGLHWEPTGLSFKQEDFEGSLIAKILINRSDPDQLIAVGQTGSYISLDSGDNWTQTSTKLFWDMEQDPVEDSVIYATTGYVHSYKIGDVAILRSTDFGATWVASNTPIPSTGIVQRVEIAIAPSDNKLIYAIACDTIGGFYGFYKSVNAGASFTEVIDNTYEYNMLGWQFDSEPGGQGRYDLAICVDKNDKDKVLVGGVNMWQTQDGGSTFLPVTYWALNYQGLSLHADIHEIVQHPANNSFFASHDGGISRAFNIIPDQPQDIEQGNVSTVWANYTNGLNVTSFYRLGVNQSNPAEIMAGAQDNSTVYGDGDVFYNVSGGDGMEALFNDEAFYRYTSSQNGRIYAYLTFDGEFMWDGTITPPGFELGEWTTPMVSSGGDLYVLYGNLYVVSGSSILTRLSNFSTIPNYSYPKIGTALAVDKKEAKIMYLAKRGYSSRGITNDIYVTKNYGADWTDIGEGLPRFAYPSYIEMSQREPNKVWISFSGFDSINKVLYSSDFGDNWKDITYDLPNVPVNCITHQNDGSDILYVGTDAGVFYLMKDSTEWGYYSNSLPKVIVSEMEIDTANKTLVAATFGRGLWEVGLIPYIDTTTIGVSKLSESNIEIDIYPNPGFQYIKLQIADMNEEHFTMKLVNIQGKVLLKEELHPDLFISKEYPISGLVPGEYFVIISNKGGRVVKKFIKH